MDEQNIPSSSHESGELQLDDENQVLKPPPRRKKSLRKSKMEADNARRITASHSGKTEKEQSKTSLDDELVKEEPLPVNVDNNNINTANLGNNLDEGDIQTSQLPAQQPANDGKSESNISKSPAQNKSNSEAIVESKAGETPEGFSGSKMTTIEDQVSKIQKRNMKNDNIDEVEEGEQDKMGNKNGSLKSNTKNTERHNPGNAKIIQNRNNGIKDTSSGNQAIDKVVVLSENFESFCLVEKVAKSNGETQAHTTAKVDQDSKEIPSPGDKDSSKSCCDLEARTSGIPAPTLNNLTNSDNHDLKSQNNQSVNNSSCDIHGDSVHDDSKIVSQVGINIPSADKKETMPQLQSNENNAMSENLEQNLQSNAYNSDRNEVISEDNTTLNFSNPLCSVYNSGIKTDDSVEEELMQKQCTAHDSLDDEGSNQDSLLPMNSGKEIYGMAKKTEKTGKKDSFPYQNLEERSNQDNTCEGDFGDDEDYSTDTDSDTYFSDFTSSEGEYDMEDAEKLCSIDDDKKKVIFLI